MIITLDGIGKQFNSDWIFRNLSFRFEPNQGTAITGRNGSGKSTLLRILLGNLHPTKGNITWELEGKKIPENIVFREMAMVAPYLELIEEFTLKEMLNFHFSFKSLMPGITKKELISILNFPQWQYKRISQYSSGMKQRVKLICALYSDTPVLILDEPTNNLDHAGIDWYLKLMEKVAPNRLVIVGSNHQDVEGAFCSTTLNIESYKS
jgi:ABC-type multidrug transport system ATPase subunit